MERTIGTVVRGVRAPIIREGDDLAQIVCDCLCNCIEQEGITVGEKDVLGITESILARAQGNYASVDDIAQDVRQKFPSGHIGVIFPILSRNRFAICLRGIAKGAKKITLMLSYPSDEVGNHLFDVDMLDEKGVAIVPGTAFGDCGEGYARISYAYSVDHITEALEKMGEFIEELKK